MRRAVSAIVVVALLVVQAWVVQAWVVPASRLARACCCKPSSSASPTLRKARCCEVKERRVAAREDLAQRDEVFALATIERGEDAPTRLARVLIDRRPPSGIANGPPYRLRV